MTTGTAPRTMPQGFIVCVDFDGVLHSYTSGWQGVTRIPDPPVPGAMDWLVSTIAHFEVAIYSSRSHEPGGREAIIQWIKDNAPWNCRNLHEYLMFPRVKPPAMLYVDDRGFRFEGDFAALTPEAIWKLKDTWQKRQAVQGSTPPVA